MADRYLVHCPECNHGDRLWKVKDETFYRCSGCKNEWFDSEVVRVKFKTIKFDGKDGSPKYLALTPKVVARWKRDSAGYYAKPFTKHQFKKDGDEAHRYNNVKSIGRAKKGWRGRRDDKLLRRLKKK